MSGDEHAPDAAGDETRQDPIRNFLLAKRGLNEADRDAVRRHLFVVDPTISIPGFRPAGGDALARAHLPDDTVDLVAAAVELRRLNGAFEGLRVDTGQPISQVLDRLRRGVWRVARQIGFEQPERKSPPRRPDPIAENLNDLRKRAERTQLEAREEDDSVLRSGLEEIAREHAKEADRVEQQLAEIRNPNQWLDEDRDLDSCRRVANRIRKFQLRARTAEEIVDNAGFRFDPETGLLDRVPGDRGGRPRRLLRNLVEAILKVYEGPLRVDDDLRAWVRDQLPRIFPINVLEGDELRSAVENAARSLRES